MSSVVHPNQAMYWGLEARRSGATNVVAEASWRGSLDPDRLGAALDAVVARHGSLRTEFHPTAGSFDPFATDLDPALLWCGLERRELDQIDVRAAVVDGPRLSARDVRKGFDPGAAPQLALRVTPRTDAGDRRLQLLTSHALFDGWSFQLFWNDLSRAYHAGSQPVWSEPAVQHGAVVERHHQRWLDGSWRRHDDAVVAMLNGAVGQGWPASAGKRSVWPLSKGVSFRFTVAEHEAFERLVATTGRTRYVVATGLFFAAVRDALGWSEAVVLNVVANRDRRSSGVVGLLANATIVRTELDGHLPGLCDAVARGLLQGMVRAEVPFPLLHAEVPAVQQVMVSHPRLMIRQQDLVERHVERGRGRSEQWAHDVTGVPDLPDDPTSAGEPAPSLGHDEDMMIDLYFQDERPLVRITYRSDKVAFESVAEVIAAWRQQLGVHDVG